MTGGFNADLVLEGGGVKGVGLVGAYTNLVQAGYRMHRIAGTSAGAIVGALIAADMPPDAMEKTMKDLDYNAFEDESFFDHLGRIGKGASVFLDKGIYEGDYLRNWLDELLTELGKATFGDLKITDPASSGLPEDQSYRLVVLASDVSRGKLVRFPWDYPSYGLDPDRQRVADAVRASISIPIFYEPVELEFEMSDGNKATSYLVDGGMLSNFPIEIFDRTDDNPPRWPTFGLKLSSRPHTPTEERFQVHGTIGLVKAMIGTMMNFHDQMHIDDPAALARTIFIDTLDVKATDFDIDESTQLQLFENGRSAATGFLSNWDFDRYVATYRQGGSVRQPA
jgi:NTE family protein